MRNGNAPNIELLQGSSSHNAATNHSVFLYEDFGKFAPNRPQQYFSFLKRIFGNISFLDFAPNGSNKNINQVYLN